MNPEDVVIKVRFVVHNLGLEGWDKSRNHWSIFLILQGGMSSVRLNMSLAHGADENGTFSINIYKYILPHNSLAYIDYDAFPSLTGMDAGSGSYIKMVFGDLKEEGYIRPSDDGTTQFMRLIQMRFHKNEELAAESGYRQHVFARL
ncbi:hypothetical protein FQN55_001733 [Onygenales sp. PD_40]|nr:hypothetical protein FQN55_001733 [Onygenales sp. PD_40]